MFLDCRELTAAPELPALTVPQYGYSNMFNGTALKDGPVISARSAGSGAF